MLVSLYPWKCRAVKVALCGPYDPNGEGRWVLRCVSEAGFADVVISHPYLQRFEPVYWEVELSAEAGRELVGRGRKLTVPTYAEGHGGIFDGMWVTIEVNARAGMSRFRWHEVEVPPGWGPLAELVNRLVDLAKAPWSDPERVPPVIKSPPDDWPYSLRREAD